MSKYKFFLLLIALMVSTQKYVVSQDSRHEIDSLLKKIKTVSENEKITIYNWNFIGKLLKKKVIHKV